MRQPRKLSYNTDSGFDSPTTSTPARAMPNVGSGFDFTQPFGALSPLYTPRAIRGSPPYSDSSSPPIDHSLLGFGCSQNSRSNSPAGSDISNVSSYDTTFPDLMNNLSLSQPCGSICSPPTEQELVNLQNLHAVHTLTSGRENALKYLQQQQQQQQLRAQLLSSLMFNKVTPTKEQILNRWSTADNNGNPLYKNPRSSPIGAASTNNEVTFTWSGQLPPRNHKASTFSCKVFLGGVPWDVNEPILEAAFSQFGSVRIEWPGKDMAASQPKGYVYIILESEKQVKALLDSCTYNPSSGGGGNWYFRISSKRLKAKEVQVIPWALSDSNYVKTPSQKLDPHTTVFVGALHGMMNAEALAQIMNDIFGGVLYAGIDTDRYKYPIGSGRVTFGNRHSYIKAVTAAFIEIKTAKFSKKVQVDPYLEDSPCSVCGIQQGPYFCREMSCFQYFCRSCLVNQHHSIQNGLNYMYHKVLSRASKSNNNSTSTVSAMCQPSPIHPLEHH